MNLIYGKCIRIEDTVNTAQMEYLMNEMDAEDILRMLFGPKHTVTVSTQHSGEQFIKDPHCRHITLMNKALLFETSFKPTKKGYIMTANMNLYTDQIRRDEVINNFLAFKQLLTAESW
jgi:DNA polymerase II large subunit